MGGWQRDRIDPVAWLQKHGVDTSHITYDPKMRRGEYSIIRGSAHDGTYCFTLELIGKTLVHVADKSSYCKSKGWQPNQRYVVGPLRLATVFGTVNLPCGRFPGERQRTRMPVRVVRDESSPQ
jgi:hypothetical protein